MDLPESIAAIGEQLTAGGTVAPAPEVFEAYDVFRVEIAQVCTRPWLAVDHVSRLAEDGTYFRVEIGSRSAVIVREAEDKIYTLRNACIHAGYRVCDEEEGRGDSLFCKYHGWSYALDGTLTEPWLRPEETDRSRFRLPRYPMHIAGGLIFIDMTAAAPNPPEVSSPPLGDTPSLDGWRIAARNRYPAAMNWKYLRQSLWSQRGLALGGDGYDGTAEFGPLSYLVWRGDEAALLRLTPRFPGQSEFEIIRLSRTGAASNTGADAIGGALRQTGDAVAAAPLGHLNRGFYDWYWTALSTARE